MPVAHREDRQIDPMAAKREVANVLKQLLPAHHAERLAGKLARAVAATYPSRPHVEGDEIADRGTERDPLYRLIAVTFMEIPDSPRHPDYALRYYATLEAFDTLQRLYTEDRQHYGIAR